MEIKSMILSLSMYNYIALSEKTQEPLSDAEMDNILDMLDGYWEGMIDLERSYVELWIQQNII